MGNTKQVILLVAFLICILAIMIIVSSSFKKSYVQKYDCMLAEISTDYPLEVKNACRKQNH